MLWKCCTEYARKSGKLSSGHRTESIFIPVPKKGNAKECSNYHIIAFILHTSQELFNILPARLQQYMNYDILDVQARFRKGRGTKDQIASIRWIKLPTSFRSLRKAREFQKKSTSALLATPKPLTVCITTNYGKF